MSRLNCMHCGGEGKLYDSKYGGNDRPTVDCPVCKGSANQVCERRGCSEDATGFNDDGEAMCEDCLLEWAAEEFGPTL